MSEDKILLGFTRPLNPPDTKYTDKDGTVKYAAILICTCKHHLWSKEEVRAHWQQGHFDTPVYAAKEEMMDRLLAQEKEQKRA